MALFGWKSALALRCGNDIIDEGDSITKVEQSCEGGSEYHVQNSGADITMYSYEANGMTHDMTFNDGKLSSTNSHRQ